MAVETFSHPQPPDFCSPCIWKDNITTPEHIFCSRPWPWPLCAALPHAGTSIFVARGCLSCFTGLIFSHFSSLICRLLGLVKARPSAKEIAAHITVLSSSSLHFGAALLAALTAWRELENASSSWYSPYIHPFPVCGPSALASSDETAHIISPPPFWVPYDNLDPGQPINWASPPLGSRLCWCSVEELLSSSSHEEG